MADLVWPPSLPASPLLRVTREQLGEQTLRTSMSAGPDKVRAVQSEGVDTFPVAFVLTPEQVSTLREFFRSTTGGGSLPWQLTNPHTGVPADFRFVSAPVITPLSPRTSNAPRYRAEFTVERLPGTELAAVPPPPPPAAARPPESFEDPPMPGDGSGTEGEAEEFLGEIVRATGYEPFGGEFLFAVVSGADPEPESADGEMFDQPFFDAGNQQGVPGTIGSGGSPSFGDT